MPSQVALLLCSFFIFYLLWREFRKKTDVSYTLWIPFLWMIKIGSKPVAVWVGRTTSQETTNAYLAGNPLDRNIILIFILTGLFVLYKRKINWSLILKNNLWIFIFILYCGMSILWSDFPFISFKRWFKSLGDYIMILIILTEYDLSNALRTIIKKFCYVVIPLSILLIKYYPDFGRYYSPWTYEVYYCGVSGGKNGLGLLCFVSFLFFFWDLLVLWRMKTASINKMDFFINVLFLMMTVYLFNVASSATPILCSIIGVFILVWLSLPFVKNNLTNIWVHFAIMVLVFLFLESTINISNIAVESLGRDSTLTGRTELWGQLITTDINPLIGVGYENFWLGDRAQYFWDLYWWHPNQAHNGYLEIYLNLGFIGVFLLGGIIVSGYRNNIKELQTYFEVGRFRMALMISVLFYNITEFTFKGLTVLWFLFIMTAFDVQSISQKKAEE